MITHQRLSQYQEILKQVRFNSSNESFEVTELMKFLDELIFEHKKSEFEIQRLNCEVSTLKEKIANGENKGK